MRRSGAVVPALSATTDICSTIERQAAMLEQKHVRGIVGLIMADKSKDDIAEVAQVLSDTIDMFLVRRDARNMGIRRVDEFSWLSVRTRT